MAYEQIPHFMGGLNKLIHPAQIENTEAQTLENLEVRPTNVSDTLSYMALTARGSYKRLHSSALDFPARNLIEFVQRVGGGSGTGSKFLVTGGFDSIDGKFTVRYLADGGTTATLLKETTSSDTGICAFMIQNQYLYYTDGALAWRSWDGVTDAASGFTTITKTGIKHKNRAFYGNDVTNGVPNRLWVSDVGLPETVSASNFFDIGDRSDPLIALQDQIERILIIKERSTWAFYLAPELANSTLLRADEYKGSVAPLGSLWASGVTWVYTPDSGMQLVEGLQYQPAIPQLMNFLKGFQNTVAALGFREDQLLISTYSDSAQTRNNRVFIYDLPTKKVFQFNMSLSCFCSNRGITTFGKRLKACEDDGTNRYIVELEAISSQVETNIACVYRTKEFTFADISRQKNILHFIVDAVYPNTTNALTLKVYADGSLVSTTTFTPTTSGYNRKIFDLLRNVNHGGTLSFQLEYTQPGNVASKFALISAFIEYDKEKHMDS